MGRIKTALEVKSKSVKNILLITKIILTLYIAVDLIYDLKAAEYDGVRWFYVSFVNLIALAFIFKESDYFKPFEFIKRIKIHFYILIGLFVASCLSLINAYNFTEGLVHISRLVNIIVGVFCVFILFKNNPKLLFKYLAKVVTLLALYHSFFVLKHFLGNYNKPRTDLFVNSFLHYFGNINIFTAALAVKLPFALYLYFIKEKKWQLVGITVFFMGWLSIFFIGSRTANISLVVIFVLTLIIKLSSKEQQGKEKVYSILKLLVPFFIILFLGVGANKIDKDKNKKNSLSDMVNLKTIKRKKNIQTIKNKKIIEKIKSNKITPNVKDGIDSERFSLWKSAIELFFEHPVLGVGYGNYKLFLKERHLKGYKEDKGAYVSIRRVHNDFLEKLAETGFLGFTFFISMFIYLTYLIFLLFKKKKNLYIVFVLFFIFFIYSFDTLLNFPIERPTVVLYLILVSSGLLGFIYSIERKEEDLSRRSFSGKHRLFFVLIFLFSALSAYSNYLVYNSQKTERTLNFDLKGKDVFGNDVYKYSYQDVKNMWQAYPNINSSGSNKYYQLALYALKEKKYKKSLEILNQNKNHTQHQLMINDLKAKIYYFGLKNVDSGKYYAEKVFEKYPGYYNNYFTLKTLYEREKDTVNLQRVMNRYTNYNYVHISEWKKKADYMFDITKDIELAMKIIDTAIAFNPNSRRLINVKRQLLRRQKIKSYIKDEAIKSQHQLAVNLFNQRKFDEAKEVLLKLIDKNPKDYFALQNIGIIELIEGKYYKAIKYLSPVIKAKVFREGKAEYSRGYAYEKTNQLKKARADFRKSRRKKYHQAMMLKAERYLEPKGK